MTQEQSEQQTTIRKQEQEKAEMPSAIQSQSPEKAVIHIWYALRIADEVVYALRRDHIIARGFQRVELGSLLYV